MPWFRTLPRLVAWAGGLAGASACTSLHVPLLAPRSRPTEIAREWVDVRKSTPSDTSLWVLRPDGYDGSAHIRAIADSSGQVRAQRTETRYGGWYMSGTLGDTASQAICFSSRPGRFGSTCNGFSLDTVQSANASVVRLTVRGYAGSHSTTNRVLISRAAPNAAR
jgi:hypothetical protein